MARAPASPHCTIDTVEPLREALQVLADDHAELFRAHFGRGEIIRVPRGMETLFERFGDAGLSTRRRGRQIPLVRVVPFFGRFIATDRLDDSDSGQVFPLMFEQVYLVRNLGVHPGDRVLELCVGSGANALAAADEAADVLGVDLNPRALDFARFNQRLNGAGSNCTLREGDLFSPLKEVDRFDLVFVNPPFEAVPADASWFLHSHGGPDGLDVIRRILAGLPQALAPGGRFEIITWSPGSEAEVALVPMMRAALPQHDLLVHHLNVEPMRDACEAFAAKPGFDAWQAELHASGLTHMHFVFVSASPTRAVPTIQHIDPEEEADRCRDLAASWD